MGKSDSSTAPGRGPAPAPAERRRGAEQNDFEPSISGRACPLRRAHEPSRAAGEAGAHLRARRQEQLRAHFRPARAGKRLAAQCVPALRSTGTHGRLPRRRRAADLAPVAPRRLPARLTRELARRTARPGITAVGASLGRPSRRRPPGPRPRRLVACAPVGRLASRYFSDLTARTRTSLPAGGRLFRPPPPPASGETELLGPRLLDRTPRSSRSSSLRRRQPPPARSWPPPELRLATPPASDTSWPDTGFSAGAGGDGDGRNHYLVPDLRSLAGPFGRAAPAGGRRRHRALGRPSAARVRVVSAGPDPHFRPFRFYGRSRAPPRGAEGNPHLPST